MIKLILMKENQDEKVKCMVCHKYFGSLTKSHLQTHKLHYFKYKEKFPNSQTSSKQTIYKRNSWRIGRKLSKETRKKISDKHKGKKLSEEHKRKIGLKFKGRKLTSEHKKKIKEYQRIHGNPRKGKKASEETKRKISLGGIGRIPWNKGKSISKETKEKISKKLKGRKLPIITKLKMSVAGKGKIISKKTRKKMSEAKKGKKMTKEHKINYLKSLSLNKSPNKFEEKCIKLFKEDNLPLKFVGDFKDQNFFFEGKVPDFVSTNKRKIIIEVFHKYWKIKSYGSIEKYKKERSILFSKYGWKTLFFSCEDIKLRSNQCLEILKKELKQNGN